MEPESDHKLTPGDGAPREPKIEMISLEALSEYESNSRTHDTDQIEQLKRSMTEFGFTNPILIDATSEIIAGHGRLRAAKELGLEEAPCIRLGHLTDAQKRAYVLADNRLALNAGWDEELLAQEIARLEAEDFDISLLGFTDEELHALGEDPATDGDPDGEVEQPPAFTQRGDIYELISADGERTHRLMCGDSTSLDDVDRLMGGLQAQLVFTDPPYGVSYESTKGEKIQNDEKTGDDLVATLLAPAFRQAARVSTEDAAFYIWHASSTRREFDQAIDMADLIEKQYLIWAKPSLVLGRADYHWMHEPCYYCRKKDSQPRFIGGREGTTVWELSKTREGDVLDISGGVKLQSGEGKPFFLSDKLPKTKGRTVDIGEGVRFQSGAPGTLWRVAMDPHKDLIHPTQKPIQLAQKAIDNHILADEVVLDLFGGSGSTLIACETKRCIARLMDLDGTFCDRIVARFMQTFTGSKVLRNGEPLALADLIGEIDE